MKILLIEDSQANIAVAMHQFVDHDLTVCQTVGELDDLMSTMSGGDIPRLAHFDLVLTDMNVVVGMRQQDGLYRAESSGQELPIGLVVLLGCRYFNVPCLFVSDGDHHQNLLCRFLGTFGLKGSEVCVWTSCYKTDDGNGGKDWMRMLERSGIKLA